MNETTIFIIIIILALFSAGAWALARYSTKVTLWEHESGLLFRHGKFDRVLEAGRHRLWGRGFQTLRFDTRWRELVVNAQEVLTADRATARLSAVVIYRVADARTYHAAAENPLSVLYIAVQLALRDLAGAEEVEALIERKGELGKAAIERVASTAGELGLELREVALRDIGFNGDLKRAFASVIQARAESKAAVEKARGESAAIRTLANAARVFENNPQLLRLRYLKMLEEKGSDHQSTYVLGDPHDWLRDKSV